LTRICTVLVSAGFAVSCGGASSSSTTPSDPGGSSNTVTITANGVSPKNIAVSAGAQVTFVDADASHDHHLIASDPHPEHNDCPPINDVGYIVNGQSRQTGNLVTKRVCGYHDHDFPQDSKFFGTITIQ
jgi:plastocyanin